MEHRSADPISDFQPAPPTDRPSHSWRSIVVGIVIGLCVGSALLWVIRPSRRPAAPPVGSGLVRDQTGRVFPAADLAAMMRAQTQPTSQPGPG